MKTKDIIKILKLVKKIKKHKKRKRHHSKKKVTIAPTQIITPSNLKPYEISRQVPMSSTNNLGLDNLRLNNILLESKMKEGNDANDKINDINNKLVTYDANNQNFNNMFADVSNKLITFDNDNKNLANQYNDVNNKLIAYDPNLNTTRFNDVDRDILEVKNKNKDASDRLNNLINAGNAFMNETKRNFKEQKLLNSKFNRFDDLDDRFDMFNPLLIKHNDLYDIPGSAEKKEKDEDEEKEQSNTPNSSVPSIPDNTIPEEEKSSIPQTSTPKPSPKLTRLEKNKRINNTIDIAIEQLEKDKKITGDILTIDMKKEYKKMYDEFELSKYPNASTTKSAIINNLKRKKVSIKN